MALFDRCADCRSCCRVDDEAPPLEVTLTSDETRSMGSICIETQCRNLTSKGCQLGKSKPFSCDLYPLSYDPKKRQFLFDQECPLLDTYTAQLADQTSDASKHLTRMTQSIRKLERSDKAFLTRNFLIDCDYFDLKPIGQSID